MGTQPIKLRFPLAIGTVWILHLLFRRATQAIPAATAAPPRPWGWPCPAPSAPWQSARRGSSLAPAAQATHQATPRGARRAPGGRGRIQRAQPAMAPWSPARCCRRPGDLVSDELMDICRKQKCEKAGETKRQIISHHHFQAWTFKRDLSRALCTTPGGGLTTSSICSMLDRVWFHLTMDIHGPWMIRSALLSEVREGFEELAKCFPTPSGWQLIGSEALQTSADGSQQFDLSWIPAWKLPNLLWTGNSQTEL